MRRKWTIILVLLLLVVATAMALLATDSWRVLAYDRVVRIHSERGYRIVTLEKRASWLPGPEMVLPTQECHSCFVGFHLLCTEVDLRRPEFTRVAYPMRDGSLLFVGEDFRCSCRRDSCATRK